MDKTKVRQTVTDIVAKFQEFYVFPDVANDVKGELTNRLEKGQYEGVSGEEEFAALMTEQLRFMTKDKHIKVFHMVEEQNEVDEEDMWWRNHVTESGLDNYGFQKVERLPGNIGYINLTMFNDPAITGETCAAAMSFIANTSALIIDLRNNRGGWPSMVQFFSSYFFEEETHLNSIYTRVEDSTKQFWTLPYVPGKKYTTKPIYVLTSSLTFSGAEEFAYNMMQLKRATVVGEQTRGGANPVRMVRINEHFTAHIPVGHAINPYTKSNWEGVGITPHIVVPKEEAFDIAYKALLKDIQEKVKDDNTPGHQRWRKEVEQIVNTMD